MKSGSESEYEYESLAATPTKGEATTPAAIAQAGGTAENAGQNEASGKWGQARKTTGKPCCS